MAFIWSGSLQKKYFMPPTETGFISGDQDFTRTRPEELQSYIPVLYALMKRAKEKAMEKAGYTALAKIEGEGQNGCFKIENPRGDGSRGMHTCDVDNCRIPMSGDYALFYSGSFFVFPAGIIHYMNAHGFSPPEDFLQAVQSLGSELGVLGEKLPEMFKRMVIM